MPTLRERMARGAILSQQRSPRPKSRLRTWLREGWGTRPLTYYAARCAVRSSRYQNIAGGVRRRESRAGLPL